MARNDLPADPGQSQKKEKAEIHRGEETGIRKDAYNAGGFAPKGERPLSGSMSRNRGIMISSISNQGKVRFMLYRETMTANVLSNSCARMDFCEHVKIAYAAWFASFKH